MKHTSISTAGLCIAAALALSLGGLAAPAGAADAPMPASDDAGASGVPGVVTVDSNGAYIGTAIGGAWSHATNTTSRTGYDRNGFTGALYAGYNMQFDQWVLGLEADLSLTGGGTEKFRTGPITEAYFAPLATARLRAGYAVDSTLFYATGGLSQGIGAIKSVSGATTKTEGTSHTGFVVGAGVEHALTENWRVRAEYLYHDYGEEDYVLASGARQKIDFKDAQTARIGVSWQF